MKFTRTKSGMGILSVLLGVTQVKTTFEGTASELKAFSDWLEVLSK